MAGLPLATEGFGKLRNDLALIAERALNPEEQYQAAFRELEAAEKAVFAGLGGRYVASGATAASLTDSNDENAVREVHGFDADFGTSVWYAHFLTHEIVHEYHDYRLGGSAIVPDDLQAVSPGIAEGMMRVWMAGIGVGA